MRAVAGSVVRISSAPILVLAGLGILSLATATGRGAKYIAPIVVLSAIFAALHRSLLKWHSLVGLIVAVVLFVPIGRYSLPANLPFNLELYRLVVALVVLIWLSSLLIDRRVRLRSTPFDRR